MKKIFILSIVSFLIFIQTSLKAEVVMIGVVEGMICMDCQAKVTEELSSASGEANVIVSWPEGVAIINFADSATFTEANFKKVITDAGFKVGKVASFDEKIIDPKKALITLKKF